MSSQPPPVPSPIPAKLGRYEIVDRLGQGAMGIVYKARDPIIDRIVALKTIDVHLSGDALRAFNERFFQEAKSAGGLNHPNIVTIYDAGEADGIAYIAMEYLEGPSLRQILDDDPPLALPKILELVAQVARGLAYAHEHGVVHLDIKPANVIVVNKRRPKITDFGIARIASASAAAAGELAGSPKYMSPEQVRREELDGRSDLFSLGTVLYELLTGKQPFTGDSVNEIVANVLQTEPPAPSTLNPRVPEAVDRVVARLMAKRSDDRYGTARQLFGHLVKLYQTSATEERKKGVTPATSRREAAAARTAPDPAKPLRGEDTTVVLGTAPRRGGPSGSHPGRWLFGTAAAVALAVAVSVLRTTDPPDNGDRVTVPTPVAVLQPPPAPVPAPAVPPAIEPPPQVAVPALPAPKTPAAVPRVPAKTVAAPPPRVTGSLDEAHGVPPPAPPVLRETATLHLAVSPWGEVFIDGQSRGTSPPLASIQLAPGAHRVEVRNSSLAPYRVEVTLQSGDTQRIKHRFE